MKELRRQLFYEMLTYFDQVERGEWIEKKRLAYMVNAEHNVRTGHINNLYELNFSDTAHDICSLMNTDRLAINESLAFEKIILVKDNKFKIATREETLAEEEKIRATALKALWRGSLLRAKRLQDGQIIVDFEKNAEKVIETFGGSYDI